MALTLIRRRFARNPSIAIPSILLISSLYSLNVRADAVTDWNITSVDIIAEQIKSPAMANRAVALVQTSVYSAVNAITQKYPVTEPAIEAQPNASVEAAIATANHRVLGKLFPKIEAAIDEAYESALGKLPDDQSRVDGISVGERAADVVFALRKNDKVGVPESYRPLTKPGAYVPTVIPVASTWSDNREPWALTSADQFRPAAPPSLDSERWAQDYNEIKTIGAHDSKVRTEEQSAAARFWVATSPKVYFPVVQSVTSQPGRDLSRNARLYAITSQAIEDALIAVFDAKYHYSFWRPMTAIRNGDTDDNEATERQADWKPMVKTPMHPEYPCAHCIVSGAVGTSLKLDLGSDPVPVLSSSSPTDGGATRTWDSIDEFMQEVADARVWEGVHYRNSAEVGSEMGRLIAEQVASTFPAE